MKSSNSPIDLPIDLECTWLRDEDEDSGPLEIEAKRLGFMRSFPSGRIQNPKAELVKMR